MNRMEEHSTFNIQRSTPKGSPRVCFVGGWELNVECSMLTRYAS